MRLSAHAIIMCLTLYTECEGTPLSNTPFYAHVHGFILKGFHLT